MPITAYPPTPETSRPGILSLFAQPAFRLRYFVVGSLTFVVDIIVCLMVFVRGHSHLTFYQGCLPLFSMVSLAYLWRRAIRQHEFLYEIQSVLLRQADEKMMEAGSPLNIALCVSADLINSALVLACFAVYFLLGLLFVKLGQISLGLLIAYLALAFVMILLAGGLGKCRYLMKS